MTYQAYVGPGAHIVEKTLQSLLCLYPRQDTAHAIIAALRHLRNVVAFGSGETGLKRFDDDLLYMFNKFRTMPTDHAFTLALSPGKSIHPTSAERVKILLIDALESCLLLNAKGQYTSTDILIELLCAYLFAIEGPDANLGDLLLDLKTYKTKEFQNTTFWPSQGIH
ncbi:hypothetical protein [Terasakiella pusilla]|uniref:hypothetical protein n=1 Tax=Terasakiella pusilla TaxID=64973 RepID=UPI003AA91703